MRNFFAAFATVLGLALLFGLRVLGLYSHQAFVVVIMLGLLWATGSRLWLWRKRRLRWLPPSRIRDGESRHDVIDAGGRALFWIALGICALVIFPRSAEMVPLIGVVLVLAALRVVATFLVSVRRNPGTTIAMALAGLVLFVDMGRGFVVRPAPVIALVPPFEGEWIVLQGGQSPMLSHHLSACNQKYAVDLMKLDDDGKIFVEDGEGNAASASWEQPILAPVAGRVVVANGSIDDSQGRSS